MVYRDGSGNSDRPRWGWPVLVWGSSNGRRGSAPGRPVIVPRAGHDTRRRPRVRTQPRPRSPQHPSRFRL